MAAALLEAEEQCVCDLCWIVERAENLVSHQARARLEQRARLLAWGGIGWHVVEFAVALAALALVVVALHEGRPSRRSDACCDSCRREAAA